MENSHGKDISLQCTTVKVPGMKPRGSRVVMGTTNTTTPSDNSAAISTDMDAMHLVAGAGGNTPGGTASTTNSSSSVNSTVSVNNTTPGRANAKDKVSNRRHIYILKSLILM